MFFFIAGIQPKTVDIEDHPRICLSCGLYQARLKRTDHYFSVFFLPIFRVKEGNPFLECQSCGSLSHDPKKPLFKSSRRTGHKCPFCGSPLEPKFRFCPFCGKPV